MQINFILLISLIESVMSIVCPLCPVIAGAAIQGGFLSSNPVLASSLAAATTFPFVLAFIDGFRTRNMTFNFPNPGKIYHADQQYSLFMNTFGLASRVHLRTADLYLLDVNFTKVLKIASEKEFKVLHHVERSKLGTPQKGIGYMDFRIPSSIPTGFYYVKYVSGWSVWRHESKFEAISDVFVIAGVSDVACKSLSCLPSLDTSLIVPPSSFTVETAPVEIQFMFSHSKNAPQHFLNGVVDGVEFNARATINPNVNAMKHPIQAAHNVTDQWENTFQRDPFRATGQAVGLGLSVGIPAHVTIKKVSEKLAEKKSNAGIENIPVPSPPIPPKALQPDSLEDQLTHLFKIEVERCADCASAIKKYLAPHGDAKVSLPGNGNKFIHLENAQLKASEIVAMIENDLGLVVKHVASFKP